MKQRQQKILEILKRKKYVSVTNLSKELNYSESTIRRDLNDLTALKMIRRTAGGALLIKDEFIENPDILKYHINKEEKELIAELAIDFIEDYNTLFLDSSSTCQILAEKLLRKKNLTIVTTNLSTALVLEENKTHKIYTIGGVVRDGKIGGSIAERMLSEIQVDLAFISCRGFDCEFGASDMLESEAAIKKVIQKNAQQMFLLVDNSKLTKKFTFKSLSTGELTAMITDSRPEKTIESFLNHADVELIYWND